MKIYFAGSIRGGRNDAALYQQLIERLQDYGTVLTEHIGDPELTTDGDGESDEYIHNRDLKWLLSSDAVIAETTTPSLGVGYEIGRAVEHKIPVLCLFRPGQGAKLSAMVSGCPKATVLEYSETQEAFDAIGQFFAEQF